MKEEGKEKPPMSFFCKKNPQKKTLSPSSWFPKPASTFDRGGCWVSPPFSHSHTVRLTVHPLVWSPPFPLLFPPFQMWLSDWPLGGERGGEKKSVRRGCIILTALFTQNWAEILPYSSFFLTQRYNLDYRFYIEHCEKYNLSSVFSTMGCSDNSIWR